MIRRIIRAIFCWAMGVDPINIQRQLIRRLDELVTKENTNFWDAEQRILGRIRRAVEEEANKRYATGFYSVSSSTVEAKAVDLISKKVADDYIEKNAVKILKKIDVGAVANSITLSAAGAALGELRNATEQRQARLTSGKSY